MFDFGLLEVVVLRRAPVQVVRDAVGGVGSAAVRGDLVRGGPLPLAPRNGDAVLPMPGVLDREGGLLGLLIAGLSQDEKKSSGSPAGVLVPLPSLASVASSTTTLSGFLCNVSLYLHTGCPYQLTSSDPHHLFVPLWDFRVVYGLDRRSGETFTDVLELLVARRSQEDLKPCRTREF